LKKRSPGELRRNGSTSAAQPPQPRGGGRLGQSTTPGARLDSVRADLSGAGLSGVVLLPLATGAAILHLLHVHLIDMWIYLRGEEHFG
jgi:hypothetical protein